MSVKPSAYIFLFLLFSIKDGNDPLTTRWNRRGLVGWKSLVSLVISGVITQDEAHVGTSEGPQVSECVMGGAMPEGLRQVWDELSDMY